MTEEIWIDIPKYEGLYEASSLGRIKSCARIVVYPDGKVYNKKDKILKEYLRKKDNRPQVTLYLKNKKQNFSVHKLICTSFHGPANGLWALHKDGNPNNNAVDNLYWGTQSDNELDKVSHGKHWESNKVYCPIGHQLGKDNNVIGEERRNGRSCLACSRARSYARYHPSVDIVELSNLCYEYKTTPGKLKKKGLI